MSERSVNFDLLRGLAERFINSSAFFFTFTLANQRGMTEFNVFFTSRFLVLNETALGEGFIALFFLLGFEIGSVSGVTFLTVTMLASDNIIVLGFFCHDHFVNASFSSSGNGSNV